MIVRVADVHSRDAFRWPLGLSMSQVLPMEEFVSPKSLSRREVWLSLRETWDPARTFIVRTPPTVAVATIGMVGYSLVSQSYIQQTDLIGGAVLHGRREVQLGGVSDAEND